MARSLIRRYNPQDCDPDELKATFAGQRPFLDRLIEFVRSQGGKDVKKHFLLHGPRGIGKTHLIQMLFWTIERPEVMGDSGLLSRLWLPLRFAEEEQGVSSAETFARRVANLLLSRCPTYREAFHERVISEPGSAEHVRELLEFICHVAEREGKNILIFAENFHRIYRPRTKAASSGSWKEVLTSGRLLLVATDLQNITVRKPIAPLFEGNREPVPSLDAEQFFELIEKRAQYHQDEDLLKCLPDLRPKIRALHVLCGGFPRYALHSYHVLRPAEPAAQVTTFEQVLDDVTGQLKQEMGQLTPQQEAVLRGLMEIGRPAGPAQIARKVGIRPPQVRNQLKRIEQEIGLIRSQDGGVLEPSSEMFQMFYEMRYLPEHHGRAAMLARFVERFFSVEERRGLAYAIAETPERARRMPGVAALVAEAVADPLVSARLFEIAADESLRDGMPNNAAQYQERAAELRQKSGEPGELLAAAEKLYEQAVAQGDDAKAAEAKLACGRALLRLEKHDEALRAIEGSRDHARESGDSVLLVRALTCLANELGPEATVDIHREIAGLAASEGDLEKVSRAWGKIGQALCASGDTPGAEAAWRRSIEFGQESENWDLAALAWVGVGLILEQRGEMLQAEAAYRESIAYCERCDESGLAARAWGKLGFLLDRRGQVAEAEAAYRKAIEFAQDAGAWAVAAQAYQNLGATLWRRNESSRAEPAWHRSTELAERDKAWDVAAKSWSNLAVLLKERGEPSEAEGAYGKTIEFAERAGEWDVAGRAWLSLATLLQERSEQAGAERAFRKAIELAERTHAWDVAGSAWFHLGLLLKATGNPLGAEAAWCRSSELAERAEAWHVSAGVWCNLGVALRERGENSQAEAAYRKSVEFAQRTEAWDVAARAGFNLAVLLQERGEHSEAETAFRNSIESAERAEAWDVAGSASTALGTLLGQRGDTSEAKALWERTVGLAQEHTITGDAIGDAHGNLGIAAREDNDSVVAVEHFVQAAEAFQSVGDSRMARQARLDAFETQLMSVVAAARAGRSALAASQCERAFVCLQAGDEAEALSQCARHLPGLLACNLHGVARLLLGLAGERLDLDLERQGLLGLLLSAVEIHGLPERETYARLNTLNPVQRGIVRAVLEAAKPNSHYLAGVALIEEGQLAEGAAELAMAVAKQPQDVAVWADLAECRHGLREFEEAVTCWEQALALRPGDSGHKRGLARTLLRMGHPDRAAKELSDVMQMTEQEGERSDTRLELAEVLLLEGRVAEAQRELDELGPGGTLTQEWLRVSLRFLRALASFLADDRNAAQSAVADFVGVVSGSPEAQKREWDFSDTQPLIEKLSDADAALMTDMTEVAQGRMSAAEFALRHLSGDLLEQALERIDAEGGLALDWLSEEGGPSTLAEIAAKTGRPATSEALLRVLGDRFQGLASEMQAKALRVLESALQSGTTAEKREACGALGANIASANAPRQRRMAQKLLALANSQRDELAAREAAVNVLVVAYPALRSSCQKEVLPELQKLAQDVSTPFLARLFGRIESEPTP